jgi:hypothetical protein
LNYFYSQSDRIPNRAFLASFGYSSILIDFEEKVGKKRGFLKISLKILKSIKSTWKNIGRIQKKNKKSSHLTKKN